MCPTVVGMMSHGCSCVSIGLQTFVDNSSPLWGYRDSKWRRRPPPPRSAGTVDRRAAFRTNPSYCRAGLHGEGKAVPGVLFFWRKIRCQRLPGARICDRECLMHPPAAVAAGCCRHRHLPEPAACFSVPALPRESNVVDKLLNRRYAALYPHVFVTYRRDTGARGCTAQTGHVSRGARTGSCVSKWRRWHVCSFHGVLRCCTVGRSCFFPPRAPLLHGRRSAI